MDVVVRQERLLSRSDTRPAALGGTGHIALGAALLVVTVAVWAVVSSLLVFPYLSDNNDEAVYLLQADALRHGRLFPLAPPSEAEAFHPWFTVQVGDRFIPKYTPVHAGLIALAWTLLGSGRAALAIMAAGVVLSGYLLAREVLGGGGQALLAAAFLALSPLFLMQSATFLGYLSALALLQGFAAALIGGVRRASPLLLVLSGLAWGLAFFARQFDALLFAFPFGLWFVVTRRRELRRLASEAGWLILGAIGPVAGLLAYHWAATGNALRTTFNLLEPSDTIGFGFRRMIPDWNPIHYTPARALEGLILHVELLAFWCFGGLILVCLAAVAVRARPKTGAERWLALVAVSVPLGYFFFWGSWGATSWGAPWRLGPFYYLPLLTPLSILGARGFAILWQRARRLSCLTFAIMLALSGLVLARSIRDNLAFTEEHRSLFAPLLETPLEHSVVFLPRIQGPWLLHPFSLARNDISYDGQVIWALDRGDDANLEVLRMFPDRTPYRLRVEGAWLQQAKPPNLQFTTTLERLEVLRAPSVTFDLLVRNPTEGKYAVLNLTYRGRTDSFVLDPEDCGSDICRLPLRIDSVDAELLVPTVTHKTTLDAGGPPDDALRISVFHAFQPKGEREFRGERRVGVRQDAQGVEILLEDGPHEKAVIAPVQHQSGIPEIQP